MTRIEVADFAMIWKHYNGWPIIVVFAVVALISIIVEGQMKFWKDQDEYEEEEFETKILDFEEEKRKRRIS